MDPISFFVAPVTIVICKHVPTANDPTHHLLDVHKICRKKKHRQWQKMTTSGVVDHDVLELLLQEHADNFVNLVRLMIKFGLLVHLQSGGSAKDEYLVPALLPPSSSDGTWSDSQWSTCFLVFTTSEEFQQFTTISEKDLNMYGFLPSGLFERLIGKAVIWAQNTSANQSYTNFLLNHDEAILFFGSQRFRLKVRDDICSIEVNIEGLNPKAVHQRLMEQVQTIIEECMKSLFCFTALQYPFNMSNSSTAPFQLSEDCFLIPLGQIRSIVDSHSVLNRPGGRRLLTEAEAKTMYRDWLPNYEQRVNGRTGEVVRDDEWVERVGSVLGRNGVYDDLRKVERDALKARQVEALGDAVGNKRCSALEIECRAVAARCKTTLVLRSRTQCSPRR
jgi:hypothetical protein